MEQTLIDAGLSDSQAKVYLYLLEHGASAPPTIAKGAVLTRTNAYKVLESLDGLGLVHQEEVRKKIVYTPADPTALATLVAQERNRVVALEESVKIAMNQLRTTYRRSSGNAKVQRRTGAAAIKASYQAQAEAQEPIYFVKSRADIPFMGHETMHGLRYLAAQHGTKRYGITPNAPEVQADLSGDKRTNLTRTPIPLEEYTSPVEWAASGDELAIIKFDGEGEVITIADDVIAESFRELWKLAAKAR